MRNAASPARMGNNPRLTMSGRDAGSDIGKNLIAVSWRCTILKRPSRTRERRTELGTKDTRDVTPRYGNMLPVMTVRTATSTILKLIENNTIIPSGV